MSEHKDTKAEVRRIFEQLSPDAQRVLAEVIKIERHHLHKGKPHGIVGELQTAIEKAIR
jgi:hypothetical protein